MKSARVLIAGGGGFLGQRISRGLRRGGHPVIDALRNPTGEGQYACRFDNIDDVYLLAERVGTPDAIVFCAGNKNIPALEADHDLALRANVAEVMNLAAAFGDAVKMIYLSSDYVFDGRSGPYRETDAPCPDTEYGKSKLRAETYLRENHPNSLSLRVSGVYDAGAKFTTLILSSLSKGEAVECYTDSFYSPLWIEDMLSALESILSLPQLQGVLHISGGAVSRYEFAAELAQVAFGHSHQVVPVRMSGSSILRPNLALLHERAEQLFGFRATPLVKSFRVMMDQQDEVYSTLLS